MRALGILLLLMLLSTFLLATGLGAPSPAIIVEADGRISLVPCVEMSDITFHDGEFLPRCAVVWSGELVRWSLGTGAMPGSQLDAAVPEAQCVNAARDAHTPEMLVAKFLFDTPVLRVTTDFETSRVCAQDLAQSGLSHATLPIEDPRTGARMLVVVRSP